MKKVCIDSVVLIDENNVLKKILVTRVNRTTFEGLDLNNNSKIYFIKEIKEIFSRQKNFEFNFEAVKDKQSQLSLF
jgi:hypothetical protein